MLGKGLYPNAVSGFVQAGLSAPRTARVWREEGGCPLGLLRPHMPEGGHAPKTNYFLLTWHALPYTMPPAHMKCARRQYTPEPVLTEANSQRRY